MTNTWLTLSPPSCSASPAGVFCWPRHWPCPGPLDPRWVFWMAGFLCRLPVHAVGAWTWGMLPSQSWRNGVQLGWGGGGGREERREGGREGGGQTQNRFIKVTAHKQSIKDITYYTHNCIVSYTQKCTVSCTHCCTFSYTQKCIVSYTQSCTVSYTQNCIIRYTPPILTYTHTHNTATAPWKSRSTSLLVNN